MSELRPSTARRALPFVVGLAFLMTVAIATWRMATLRGLALEQERERTVNFVREFAEVWEGELMQALNARINAPPLNAAMADGLQRRLTNEYDWFDSLYVWRLPNHEGREGELFFPTPPVGDRRAVLVSRPCVQHAIRMAQTLEPTAENHSEIADAFVVGCANEDLLVRINAASEAAYFLQDQHPARALQAMDALRVDPGLTLGQASRLGIPPSSLAIYKHQRAKLLVALGHDVRGLDDRVRRLRLDQGLQAFLDLGMEIVDLDAPEAAVLLTQYGSSDTDDVFGIRRQLLRHGRHEDAQRLRAKWDRAERRRAAFKEINDKIVTQMPDPKAKPKFVRDQYSEKPYLLYFGWSETHGVAFQLEQDRLLYRFLTRLQDIRHAVSITDADGERVAGARLPPDAEAVEIAPFKGLTHLRIHILESALVNAARMRSENWVLPFAIMGLCAALGFTALVAQAKLTRQQYELMNRQRAFTTRVTHELKTPLAGIRLMAENLEAGVFRTDDQREEMARRIVEEADRLKSRVDEVLDVARERTIPSPVPIDPEEALLDAINQWGPRLEQAGIRLHADLHPTDEVVGDLGALRDAVGILLDNALKYRRPDRDDPQVWLELTQEGRHVVIAVADNGLGVPKSMRKAIFDRFVRVEGPNRGTAGGHGLGLNQAREIVEAHQGTLVCIDGVDGGARFVLRIPARRAP